MAAYREGDVLQAKVRVDGRGDAKVRPVVVIGQEDAATLRVLPVTSRSPVGAPHVPIELVDFVQGGLDFFEASYVLTTSECRVGVREVRGRNGRLAREPLEAIRAALPSPRGRAGKG
ncbi:MAG: type II toxin-antitoxin system PemK/MazF family toxin [Methanomicrobiaceae archaeon]|nr:type II toxin-antitoxin system PemK/MazF family toxin [Methanomicrobiaceae archaeon]